MDSENFVVSVNSPVAQGKEEIIPTMQELEEMAAKRFYSPEGKIYQVYLKENEKDHEHKHLPYERLRDLAKSPQSDIRKTLEIIEICRQYANMDDIIGLTNECIENNVNTQLSISFPGKTREETEKERQLIDEFNEMIDIESVIARVIPCAWRDGTCIYCLRKKLVGGKVRYTVDFYPLGVAIISDYEVEGQPYVLIDIQELKRRLTKMYPKQKNRKGLFFDNMEQEIKAAYPPEVYKAFKEKEKFAKIPIEFSGVARVNNQNKPFGLSPIFRSLWPTLMLEAFGNADRSTANARSKKIIAQFLHKEILGENYNRDSYGPMAYAHQNLMEAWKMPTVVVTAPATVEDIKYVEPKAETTNINLVNYYRQKAMSTLGISFLADSNSSSLSVANISLKQLMKTINKISRQMQTVITKWYEHILLENGFSADHIPTVQIMGAEMMELEMRKELADALFTKLNCSYETAYTLMGVDFENEKNIRAKENKQKVEEVFQPRATAYTASAENNNGENGRPTKKNSDDPDKQGYDKDRNMNT